MPQPPDIKIFLHLDGDEIPLQGSMTVGRELDNDLMIAGEDVLDFHLRLTTTDRGVRAHPLGEASLIVNEQDWAEPVGLIPGDVLRVGASEIRIGAERLGAPQADDWWLHGDRDESLYKITGTLGVGRSDENEVLLLDDHISRKHACFVLEDGVVWVRDLNSANGTYVNGQRLAGGCRLYHGDEIRFDAIRFQLVGQGQDLTPVRTPEDPAAIERLKSAPEASLDTTEINLAEVPEGAPLAIPETHETGAYLLGVSEPVAGQTFRTRIGTTVIGRDASCDIVISDPTVSARHAEIVVRPEATTVTNLMATNGTRVNGQVIQNAELHDGDVVRVGRVNLVYKDVPSHQAEHALLGAIKWVLLGTAVVLAVLLALLLV